jgi:hypothetical protein
VVLLKSAFKIRTALNIIKKNIKKCDVEINEINKEIEKKNKKQKGGKILNKIDDNEILYLLIPMYNNQ